MDNTIVDLSDRVFGAGIAFVALSRVRSGLHLANFDPKCAIVSKRCLEEIKSPRKHRPDLPLYPVTNSQPTSRNKKCIISASTAAANDLDNVASKRKRKHKTKEEPPSKRTKEQTVPQAQSGSDGSSNLQ